MDWLVPQWPGQGCPAPLQESTETVWATPPPCTTTTSRPRLSRASVGRMKAICNNNNNIISNNNNNIIPIPRCHTRASSGRRSPPSSRAGWCPGRWWSRARSCPPTLTSPGVPGVITLLLLLSYYYYHNTWAWNAAMTGPQCSSRWVARAGGRAGLEELQ